MLHTTNTSENNISLTQPCTPHIIPRDEHNISRSNIDDEALKVLYRLQSKGFIAYLVGGSVRDLLLNRKPKDFDIGTNANPQQVRKIFRNSRIIGRRFRLVQVYFNSGKVVEVSTFRSGNHENAGEVLHVDNAYGSPAEDAWRRDLTINALFYNIANFTIVDYVGGMEDLKNGCIRAVGNADLCMHQDPVRILRVIRHAARTNFYIDDATLTAIIKRKSELCVCPDSRIRDELMRDLKGGSAVSWFKLAQKNGILTTLLPTLQNVFQDENSQRSKQALKILGNLDAMTAGSTPVDDFLALAALIWPAIEEAVEFNEEEISTKAEWALNMRNYIVNILSPLNFTKKIIDKIWRASTPFYYLYMPGSYIPRRLHLKSYYTDSAALVELLNYNFPQAPINVQKPKPNSVAKKTQLPRKARVN